MSDDIRRAIERGQAKHEQRQAELRAQPSPPDPAATKAAAAGRILASRCEYAASLGKDSFEVTSADYEDGANSYYYDEIVSQARAAGLSVRETSKRGLRDSGRYKIATISF
jgi:hypothetical protein